MQIRQFNNFSRNIINKNQGSDQDSPLSFKSRLIISQDVIDHEIKLAQDCTESTIFYKKDSYEKLNFIPEERGEKTGSFFYQSYTFPKAIKSHLNDLKRKWEDATEGIPGKTEIVLNNDKISSELEEDPACICIDDEDCDLLAIYTDDKGQKYATGFDGKSLIGTFSGEDEIKDVTADSILDEALALLMHNHSISVYGTNKELGEKFLSK